MGGETIKSQGSGNTIEMGGGRKRRVCVCVRNFCKGSVALNDLQYGQKCKTAFSDDRWRAITQETLSRSKLDKSAIQVRQSEGRLKKKNKKKNFPRKNEKYLIETSSQKKIVGAMEEELVDFLNVFSATSVEF